MTTRLFRILLIRYSESAERIDSDARRRPCDPGDASNRIDEGTVTHATARNRLNSAVSMGNLSRAAIDLTLEPFAAGLKKLPVRVL